MSQSFCFLKDINIIQYHEKSLSTMKKILTICWIMLLTTGISQAKLSLGNALVDDLAPKKLATSQIAAVGHIHHDPWDDRYDDDFFYSRRLRRFHPVNQVQRAYAWNYFDPYFADDIYFVMGSPLWDAYYAPRFYGGFYAGRPFFRTRSYFFGWSPRFAVNFSFGWGGFNSWAYDPFWDFCPPVWGRTARLGWFGPTNFGWGRAGALTEGSTADTIGGSIMAMR